MAAPRTSKISAVLPPVAEVVPKGSVRMQEIAERAGVTAMTVSRALRTPNKVSPSTLERIRKAIDELGFVPNFVAGSLSSRQSRMVAVSVPSLANSVFSDFIEEMTATLIAKGYTTMVGCSSYDHKYEEEILSEFLGWRPAGVVLTGSRHTDRTKEMCKRSGVPIIETWCKTTRPLDIVVGFSNQRAVYEMTRSLMDWGYRKIGFGYVDSEHNDRSLERRRGWKKALSEAGYECQDSQTQGGSFAIHEGAVILDRLLERHPDTDAIVFGSDTLAVGALMEAQRRGLRVPQDIAITGFGDVEIAGETVPSLTTVRTPRRELGKICAEVLLQKIAGTYEGPRVIDRGFEIVRRQSA
ncbi:MULTISPECIES: LacI family DNA-binding transcriptional regulator [unclassified Chelatococcus]|uniref:LacI family DNA-binding transcriptional regulator n=1 Tax=unclassified Chelatococcus TaxID=2638111 RepID=UPI001BD145F0|nr:MULTISPECIES: LacI family DNA-binding transcriptional regulator [unclassified Chelatococcus]MBS7700632.1 LacI family DNA-binding transcriptional regulator [Chelatococcus sp. YT9]MBX3559063.1 LacI family DNA-binding transcriptional regulator [Chelatococcus sp.]